MNRPVIQVENVSKLYRLGQVSTGTIAHDFNRWWHRVRGKEDPYAKIALTNDRSRKISPQSAPSYAWALKNLSFQVNQGDVVGIIGRNGAGKSTLLKILSRVTTPTTGQIRVKGRIASLLEVGTGFHQELTGRENIFLNGAILGMGRREITRKLDEIVEFSGCAAYLDTPVKRYSSGMTVRLAFAVASHLDAEILVIDEVLAVGDSEFQKKCLGKMNDVASQGRTVLFVTHNMGLISSLCQRAILLEQGELAADTTASDGVLAYYNRDKATSYHVDFEALGRSNASEPASILEGRIENSSGGLVSDIDMRLSFSVKMRYRLNRDMPMAPFPNFHVTDSSGSQVFVSSLVTAQCPTRAGCYEVACHVPGNLLNNGTYFIGLALCYIDKGVQVAFYEREALCVNVIEQVEETLEQWRNGFSGVIPGAVRPRLDWSVTQIT
jgi:lipopolysaccharide transport system ATP-binding protein